MTVIPAYRFLSTSIGFSYLLQANYIDSEMDEWFLVSFSVPGRDIFLMMMWNQERNLQYVIQVELYLESIFGSDRGHLGDLDEV
jgi:rapamycin-insensitive companion of mTOR